MVGIFADQNMRDECLSRERAFDQMRPSWHLLYAIGAGAAGVFWAYGHDNAQLRRDDIQPLAAILPDLLHLTATTGTDKAIWLDDLFDPGQMRWQVADIALRGWPFPLGSPAASSGWHHARSQPQI